MSRPFVFSFLKLGTLLFLAFFGASTPIYAAKPKVAALEIKRQNLFEVLTYPARITSQVDASILSDTEGVVTRLNVPLGGKIKRGQPIMVIQHTDPVYKYAPVKVRAPVSGVLSSLEVTEGSRVAKAQRVATVTDPKKLEVRVDIASLDLSKIQIGTPAELRVRGQANPFPVKVQGLSPMVDSATGTAEALFGFETLPQNLRPGMLGKLTMRTNAHMGILIPSHSLIYREKKTFVRTLDSENKSHLAEVRVGPRQQGQVEILSGLQEGVRVVIRSNKYISEGEQVEVE